MSVQSHTVVVPANSDFRHAASGGAVSIIEITGPLEISFDGGSSWSKCERQFKFGVAHNEVFFKNSSLVPVQVDFVQSKSASDFFDGRLGGDIDVFGNVTTKGDPLERYGGSIASIGESSLFMSSGALTPDQQSFTLINPGLNVNGIVVTGLIIANFTSSGVSWGDRSMIEAVDGAAIRNFVPFAMQNGLGVYTAERSFFLDPGLGLRFIVNGNVQSQAYLQYEVL